jgi:hypothetical protein
MKTAAARLRVAETALATLPASQPKDILESLGGYLVERVEAARG